MIDALVFSKDRGAQLDLLLASLERYADRLYRSLTILWTASTPEMIAGYRRCRELHLEPENLRWWQQGDFETDVRCWLDGAGETISFLVDDDVFYRPTPQPSGLPWSYRGGDYDYPFSLDGNVYRKHDVVRLLRGLRFGNPTELEATGHAHRARLPFADVLPCSPPCLVGVPLNRVSDSSNMPHLDVAADRLNRAFLAGKRMQLPPPFEHDPPAHLAFVPVFA